MKFPNLNFPGLSAIGAFLLCLNIASISCSADGSLFDENIADNSTIEEEDDSQDDVTDEGTDSSQDDDNTTVSCSNPADFVFVESDGVVMVEMENAVYAEDWELQTSTFDYSGEGYLVWTGSQSLGNPGNGLIEFKLRIDTPGTYKFLWSSAVTIGDNGTEHNDTWVRFNDASDFYGQKGESIVYPKGIGKTPNPNGSSADGWFKIYRSGNDLGFKWQARTSDNDAHDIFVTFDTAGTYTMEVSARSSGHAIDKFVLFNESYSNNEATDENQPFSEISCD